MYENIEIFSKLVAVKLHLKKQLKIIIENQYIKMRIILNFLITDENISKPNI